jgi:hypothetical protein
MAVSRSAISGLVRDLRTAVARAKRNKDETGRYDTTTITITLPAHIALMAANRLELTEDRVKQDAKAAVAMRDVTAIAEDAMKDNALRFNYAVTDLEILLMEFIGRPMMTMQEVREQRQIAESIPSPGPQPFVRRSPTIKASNELTRSLRGGRIGYPREPGEDG